MTAHATTSISRFTRDSDRAVLGGVCAGFASHFGLNLRFTRLLTIIAFLFAMPLTVFAYIAIVLLIPATSHGHQPIPRREKRRKCRRESRKERRQAEEEERRQASEAFAARCRSLDERLAQIEKYVTSSRYSLDREFRNL